MPFPSPYAVPRSSSLLNQPRLCVFFFNPKSNRFFGGSGNGLFKFSLERSWKGQTPPCLFLLRPRALDLAIFLRFQVASCLLDIYESGWGFGLGWRAIMTLMLLKVVVLIAFANPWWFCFTWQVFEWNFGVSQHSDVWFSQTWRLTNGNYVQVLVWLSLIRVFQQM